MPSTVRPLDVPTWDAFAELVERDNGVFGGCWCIGYHPERGQTGISHRSVKEDRVRTGRAHAALDQIAQAFEQCEFTRARQVGKHAWVVSRVVDPL